MSSKITLALDDLERARKHLESHQEDGDEVVEPVPLQLVSSMRGFITAIPNGNCLEIDVSPGFQINFQMSDDFPGRKMWIWAELEDPKL